MKQRIENILVIFMLLGTIGIIYSLYKIAIRVDEVSSLINIILMGIGMIIIRYTVKHKRALQKNQEVKGN